jgi:hypothetical protein
MRAAGVRVHVAADRADLLRRRIGRVREAERSQLRGEVEVEHPRFDPGEAVLRADLEDPAHLRGDDEEGVAEGRRRSGEPRPAAARHDREVVPRGNPHARHDVLRRPDERDEPSAPLDHGRVARVEPSRQGVGEHGVGAEGGDELGAGGVQVRHAR